MKLKEVQTALGTSACIYRHAATPVPNEILPSMAILQHSLRATRVQSLWLKSGGGILLPSRTNVLMGKYPKHCHVPGSLDTLIIALSVPSNTNLWLSAKEQNETISLRIADPSSFQPQEIVAYMSVEVTNITDPMTLRQITMPFWCVLNEARLSLLTECKPCVKGQH